MTGADDTDLRRRTLSVRATCAASDVNALPVLASLTDVAVSVLRAAPFRDAAAVFADLPRRTVPVPQALVTTARGEALPVSAALTHGTVVVAAAGAVPALAATVAADLAACAVTIGGTRGALWLTLVVLADLACGAVADVVAAARRIDTFVVGAHLAVAAVRV